MSSKPQQAQATKLFYRIGEVSRITGLEPYVLRYWETEFPQIRPDKSKTGQRVYKQKDLDNILFIKRLLYQDGYTIAGARKRLHGGRDEDVFSVIDTVKKELREILKILK